MSTQDPKPGRCLAATAVVVLVVGAVVVLSGCTQNPDAGSQPPSVQVTNLRAREHGILNKKVEVSCDVTNSGGSGLATLTAYVAYGHEVYDSASKTIRIGAGEQIAVSFDLDIKDLGGQYDYWVS